MIINEQEWLYNLPKGWEKLFKQMCRDIKKTHIEDFQFLQVKEKFGSLRVYCNGNEAIYEIIAKYEHISKYVCSTCGKPSTKMTKGWIEPYCNECCPNDFKYDEVGEFNPIVSVCSCNVVSGKSNIKELDCSNEWERLFGEEMII